MLLVELRDVIQRNLGMDGCGIMDARMVRMLLPVSGSSTRRIETMPLQRNYKSFSFCKRIITIVRNTCRNL